MNEIIEDAMNEKVPEVVKAKCSKTAVNSAVNFVGYVAICYVGYKIGRTAYTKVRSIKHSKVKDAVVKKNTTDSGEESTNAE